MCCPALRSVVRWGLLFPHGFLGVGHDSIRPPPEWTCAAEPKSFAEIAANGANPFRKSTTNFHKERPFGHSSTRNEAPSCLTRVEPAVGADSADQPNLKEAGGGTRPP